MLSDFHSFFHDFPSKNAFFFGIVAIFVLSICIVLLLVLPRHYALPTLFVHTSPRSAIIADQLIVEFKPGQTPDAITDANSKQQLEATFTKAGVISDRKAFTGNDNILNTMYLFEFRPGTNLEEAKILLQSLSQVASITTNKKISLLDTSLPNDPYYRDKSQINLAAINIEKAWSISKGNSNITVAVIDTGVDYTHPDLAGNIIKGHNYITNMDNPMDQNGHGSHVAGIIGAVTNNRIGISGINWYIKILAINVFRNGGIFESDLASGIKEATDKGAKVINLSIGYQGACSDDTFLQKALDYATQKNVVIVAAAGNDGIDAANESPASCKGVIAVGSLSSPSDPKIRSSWSDWGKTVTISAPGELVLSTDLAKNATDKTECYFTNITSYSLCSGTSYTAPQVSGVVALILAKKPDLSPGEIKDCLSKSATPLQTDKPVGGRLDAYNALLVCGATHTVNTPKQPSTISQNNQSALLSSNCIHKKRPCIEVVDAFVTQKTPLFVRYYPVSDAGNLADSAKQLNNNDVFSALFCKKIANGNNAVEITSQTPKGNCAYIGYVFIPVTDTPSTSLPDHLEIELSLEKLESLYTIQQTKFSLTNGSYFIRIHEAGQTPFFGYFSINTSTNTNPPPPVYGSPSCQGSLIPQTCNGYADHPTMVAYWNISPQYGPNTCNVYINGSHGGEVVNPNHTCQGQAIIYSYFNNVLSPTGNYHLYLSNGNPATACYNTDVTKPSGLTLSCPPPFNPYGP